MANRIPLIVNPTSSQIQEVPVGDVVTLTNNITSSSKTTGALVVTGGVGIGSTLNVGGEITTTVPSNGGTSNRTPIVSNTPAFRAQLGGSDQTLTDGVQTLVQFATEDFDSDGCYNNTGSVDAGGIQPYSFRPNVAGFYYIFASSSIDCNQDQLRFARIQIMKNGDTSAPIAACVSGVDGGGNTIKFKEATQTASVIVEMNGTSDYISIYSDADHNSTAGAIIRIVPPPTVRSYFQAYKLIM